MNSNTEVKQPSRVSAGQILGLGVLIVIALGLLGAWYVMRPNLGTRDDTTSFLDKGLQENALDDQADSQQILQMAEDAIQELLSQYPTDPAAYSAAARKSLEVGETEAAQDYWEKSCELRPLFPEAMFGMGLIAFETDRYDDAAAYFEEVNLIKPGDPTTPLMLADALIHGGRTMEAAHLLMQNIASEQTSVQAWELLGQAYLDAKLYEEAIDCFEKVESFSPNTKDAVYGLARANAALGRKDEAAKFNKIFRDLAQQAREDNANDAISFQDAEFATEVYAQALGDSARIHRQHGNLTEAEELLLKCAALRPGQAKYWKQLLDVVGRRPRPIDTIAVCQRLLELEPENVDVWIQMGGEYANLEDADSAIEAFEKAIEIDPDHEGSKRAQSVLTALRSQP